MSKKTSGTLPNTLVRSAREIALALSRIGVFSRLTVVSIWSFLQGRALASLVICRLYLKLIGAEALHSSSCVGLTELKN